MGLEDDDKLHYGVRSQDVLSLFRYVVAQHAAEGTTAVLRHNCCSLRCMLSKKIGIVGYWAMSIFIVRTTVLSKSVIKAD